MGVVDVCDEDVRLRVLVGEAEAAEEEGADEDGVGRFLEVC